MEMITGQGSIVYSRTHVLAVTIVLFTIYFLTCFLYVLKTFGGMHAMQLPGTDHNQGSFNKYPDIFEIGDFFVVFSELVDETDRCKHQR